MSRGFFTLISSMFLSGGVGSVWFRGSEAIESFEPGCLNRLQAIMSGGFQNYDGVWGV